MVRRQVNPTMKNPNADPISVVQGAFEQIGLAKVGTSAWENRTLGYLTDEDTIVMNGDHRLAIAKQRALQLAEIGARPPEVEKIYAAGRDVYSALVVGVKSLNWGGYASDHDVVIAKKLAFCAYWRRPQCARLGRSVVHARPGTGSVPLAVGRREDPRPYDPYVDERQTPSQLMIDDFGLTIWVREYQS
ncbi:MAG: hypothetical protein M5U34_26325 [Chloroflexi bacterium]|nr:hypothetical protein [Chloroflexota bacterium]